MENNHYFSSSSSSTSSSGWPALPSSVEPNWAINKNFEAYNDSFSFPWPHSSASATFPSSCSIPIQDSGPGFPSSWSLPVQDSAEDKAASVSKSHSQAEKRRRDRINAQLGILRKLIPKSDKMDKAALLGSVIDHVKDLKGKAMEVSKTITIPTEFDEVTVDVDNSDDVYQDENSKKTSKDKENIFIRASVCCDDRPEVFSELIRVLKGLKLTVVGADISSVGGRVKSILILCNKDSEDGSGSSNGGGGGGGGGGVSISTIKQSLNVVLSRISSSSMPSNYRIRSKRQRFFLPSH